MTSKEQYIERCKELESQLIEINQSIKIQQNKVHAEERVLNALYFSDKEIRKILQKLKNTKNE